jgi:hypothetical protein
VADGTWDLATRSTRQSETKARNRAIADLWRPALLCKVRVSPTDASPLSKLVRVANQAGIGKTREHSDVYQF